MDNIPSLLKAFVIGGGILLVGGTLLLVVLIMLRAGGDERLLRRPEATLGLPRGVRIEQVVGHGERWLLLGPAGAGPQFVAEVDARTGERLSLLWLQPEG